MLFALFNIAEKGKPIQRRSPHFRPPDSGAGVLSQRVTALKRTVPAMDDFGSPIEIAIVRPQKCNCPLVSLYTLLLYRYQQEWNT
jgi:hypothetical protein